MSVSCLFVYLRDVVALVASLQQASDEVPQEVPVLYGQGFLQLLDTQTHDKVSR